MKETLTLKLSPSFASLQNQQSMQDSDNTSKQWYPYKYSDHLDQIPNASQVIMKIPKALKICLVVTAILIIILVTTTLILYFTLLKPKQPKITTQQVTMEHFHLLINPLHLNITLGILFTVDNPNYGSFKYHNTTSYVTYRGTAAAEAPLKEDTIPARGKVDISTEVLVVVDNLVSNPDFPADFLAGCLNFTATTTFHGQAKVLNIFKLKATTYSTCDISVYIVFQNASSVCTSKIKY